MEARGIPRERGTAREGQKILCCKDPQRRKTITRGTHRGGRRRPPKQKSERRRHGETKSERERERRVRDSGTDSAYLS